MTVAEFIAARLSFWEAAAEAAASRPLGESWDDGTRLTAVSAHIALHDPGRVLRQVTAMRAILAECQDTLDYEDHGYALANAILPHLAAIWADHPDYQESWHA